MKKFFSVTWDKTYKAVTLFRLSVIILPRTCPLSYASGFKFPEYSYWGFLTYSRLGIGLRKSFLTHP